MKILEIKSLLPYLITSRIIGFGTTAICYLISDNRVLKVYTDTSKKKKLFSFYDMEKHLELINCISNNSYIGPEEVLIKNGKLVAYIYPYIKAKTLRNLSDDITKDELLVDYQNLYYDTKKISDNSFRIYDLHPGNMLFDKSYYIIDLDWSSIEGDNKTEIFKSNIRDINRMIINSIFGLKYFDQYIEFEDYNLQELYSLMLYKDSDVFYEFFDALFYGNLTKKDVKKRTRVYVYNKSDYYHRYI